MMKKRLLILLVAAMTLLMSFATFAEGEMEKKGILVVSFGTSYMDTYTKTIKATEDAIAKAYPEYEVREAFTSSIIRNKIMKRDGVEKLSPEEALMRMKEEGFSEVIVQPLHVITGIEYEEVVDVVNKFNDGSFKKLELGKPLLFNIDEEEGTNDYLDVVMALKPMLSMYKDTAVVYMGHGTHHPANASYEVLERTFKDAGMNNVFVGTVEGYPGLDEVMAEVQEAGYEKVVLLPFMIVAGDHASNDMAGDEEDSWKTGFKMEGFEVEPKLIGLGEIASIQNIYIQNVEKAIEGEGVELKEKEAKYIPESYSPIEGKKALLVVSFGTSYKDTRDLTIEAIEKRIEKVLPWYDVKRAFTSDMIIRNIEKKENVKVNNVDEAFMELIKEGYEEVVVQPTHIMPGHEYTDLVNTFDKYKDVFKTAKIGQPALYHIDLEGNENHYKEVVKALKPQLEGFDDKAVVFMGHGSTHSANSTYALLQRVMNDEGIDNVFVGTVEGYPTLNDVITMVKEKGHDKVVLMPFMIVAGDHASNDMAGDEEDSWKTAFKAEGFEVEVYLHGLGENKDFQKIYIERIYNTLRAE
jgi:sirohydrochlorin cobaltochelatase